MQPDSPAYRMSLRLELDVLGGAPIEDTIAHALDVAQKLNLPVAFNFNGIRLNVSPGRPPDDVLRAYHEAVRFSPPEQISPDEALARARALAAASSAAAAADRG